MGVCHQAQEGGRRCQARDMCQHASRCSLLCTGVLVGRVDLVGVPSPFNLPGRSSCSSRIHTSMCAIARMPCVTVTAGVRSKARCVCWAFGRHEQLPIAHVSPQVQGGLVVGAQAGCCRQAGVVCDNACTVCTASARGNKHH
jgi:hypothetical protein